MQWHHAGGWLADGDICSYVIYGLISGSWSFVEERREMAKPQTQNQKT